MGKLAAQHRFTSWAHGRFYEPRRCETILTSMKALALVWTGSVPVELWRASFHSSDLLCDTEARQDKRDSRRTARWSFEAVSGTNSAAGACHGTFRLGVWGRTEGLPVGLLPRRKPADRAIWRFALASASLVTVANIRSLLLDAGEGSRAGYKPGSAGHSHSTPLHQAALGGHIEVVLCSSNNAAADWLNWYSLGATVNRPVGPRHGRKTGD